MVVSAVEVLTENNSGFAGTWVGVTISVFAYLLAGWLIVNWVLRDNSPIGPFQDRMAQMSPYLLLPFWAPALVLWALSFLWPNYETWNVRMVKVAKLDAYTDIAHIPTRREYKNKGESAFEYIEYGRP